MRARRIWLVVTAGAFVCWLGFLGYLAETTGRPLLPGTPAPVILKRPQFLASTLDVIAEVDDKDGRAAPDARVVEVHWPERGEETLVGRSITVTNLPDCDGWTGPGRYLLALVRSADTYRVASIPPSPGYDPTLRDERPPIYALTRQTREQLEHVPKPVP